MPDTSRGTPEELCRETEIRIRLAAHDFHFSKRHGQNFLTASHVAVQMAETVAPGQSVLEIGPGFGALTAALCGTGAEVVAVELDKRLLPVLDENVGGYPNLTVVQGDALTMDLQSLLPSDTKPMVCANLPYQITTPILAKLLEEGGFDPLVVMIQREVAERLTAAAGTKAYGAFTIFCAVYARVEILFPVSSDCFVPKPAVQSAVIRLRRHEKPWLTDTERIMTLRLVRAAFALRRKTLANALSAGLSLPRDRVTDILTAARIDPGLRGETLSPEAFGELARCFLEHSE